MKLHHKGLLFLLAVSAVQTLLFASFTALLIHSDREQQRARQSQLLVSTLMTAEDGMYAASVTLAMLAFEKDKTFLQQRFDHLCKDIPERIAKISTNLRMTPQQTITLNKITAGADMIIALMQECKDAVEQDALGVKTLRIKKIVDNEIWPQMGDLRKMISQMIEQQRQGDLSGANEQKARNLTIFALSGLFVGNILATALIVLGFSKTVTQRLNLIAENISAFPGGKKLNDPIAGSDEISLVDKNFHEMAAALTDATQKDKAVFANMTVGLITCDDAGVIESINPRGELLLDRTASELIGCNFISIVHPQPENFMSLADKSMDRIYKCQLRRSTTDMFPAEVSTAHFSYKGKDRYVVCAEDISEREYAEKLRSEVISIVSHDLKTPLNSIAFFLNLLNDGAYGAVDENLSAGADRAYRECKRLMHLTVDLLDLAALESGNIKLHKKEIELVEIFYRALEAVAMFAADNGIELEASNANLVVFADEDRLIQILVNYLTNAMKFSPRDNVVSISAVNEPNAVVISVTDHGRGVPEQLQEQIFDRFAQVQEHDSKIGSGLGLAICKLLARAHGGDVGVESDGNSGSRFWVRLPNRT